MFQFFKRNSLLDLLPESRGKLVENAPLRSMTTFKVGGSAEVLFTPADLHDLADFFIQKPVNIPLTVIGGGSNLLVRDGGVPGVVVNLENHLSRIQIKDDEIFIEAGAKFPIVLKKLQQEGISGFEWLAGIPCSVGGAIKMNAGAYGKEIKDVLIKATVVDSFGRITELSAEDLNFSYRKTVIPVGSVFVNATFKGKKEKTETVSENIKKYLDKRNQSQPIGTRTAGSTFVNPPGFSAWQLIEKAGCKNLKIGGALISDKHSNFIINNGRASALDIENLGEEVRQKVLEKTGINLQWEIQKIGVKTPQYSTFGGSR